MSRLFIVLIGALLVFGGLPSRAVAQTSGGVAIPGPNGEELALVTVGEIQDPFETYDASYPPIRGYHYLLVNLTVENTGSRAFQFDPGNLMLRDTEGFLYGDTSVYREEDAAAADLAYGEIAGGDTVSGVVGFQVLNGVDLSDILLIPGSGQLVHVHDLGAGERIAVGDEMTIVGHDGAEIGTVAANDLVDPYEDYPDNSPPDRGSHYVMLGMSIANTGPRPILFDPSNIFLQDTDGFLYGPQNVQRPEDAEPALEYGELAPGNDASGTVAFMVVNGVDLARVLYQPGNDRLITLADFTEGGNTPTSGPADKATPQSNNGQSTAGTGDVDCAEIEDWLTAANADASAVFGLVGVAMVMRTTDDPEYPATAHAIADAFAVSADSLRSRPAPDSVSELNDDLADAYDAYGEALDALATAVEDGDEAAIDEAGQALYDAEPALISTTGAVADLATECGIETDQ